MARQAKTTAVDVTTPQELTAGRIERLTCPQGKAQAFLRDTKAPALRVRVTPSGAKAFIFEAKLRRDTIRQTIGDVRAWTIEDARTEANRLRVLVDTGTDPRDLQREQVAAAEARKSAEAAKETQTRFGCDTLNSRCRWLGATAAGLPPCLPGGRP